MKATTSGWVFNSKGGTPPPVVFDGVGGDWTLSANTATSSTSLTSHIYTLKNGTLNLSTYTLSVYKLSTSGIGTFVLNLNSGIVDIFGTTDLSSGSLTINAGTSNFRSNGASLNADGKTLYTYTAIGSSALTGSSTINSMVIPANITMTYTAGTTQTITTDVTYNPNLTYVVDSFATGADGTTAISSALSYVAQSFQNTTACTLVSASVIPLSKTGSPTGSAYIKIYAHSGVYGTSSVPTGAPLTTSDALDVSTLTAGVLNQTFTFTGGNQITLAASTNYCVVLVYTGGDASNRINWRRDGSSPTGSGNSATSTDGTSWTADNTKDQYFQINGVRIAKSTLTSSSAGNAWTISKSSGVVSNLDYLNIKDSTATGGATWYAGANSTNQGNNSGWIFAAAPGTSNNSGFFALM
jgi:hypothetical protein